jgi:hypothetical protein
MADEKDRRRSRTMDDALRRSRLRVVDAARPPSPCWARDRDVTAIAATSAFSKRKHATPGLSHHVKYSSAMDGPTRPESSSLLVLPSLSVLHLGYLALS